MNELALFAGAGGGLLGTRLLGWHCVCGVELDPYCREVLLRRQEEGHLEAFPIWDDVRTFDGKPWRGRVDVVTAGFPCQPFSSAGWQLGESDERNMWPDTIRIIREVGPRFCLLENVPALLADKYFGTILGQLSESGFDVRWDVISAAATGSNQLRERLWIAAPGSSANSLRWERYRAHSMGTKEQNEFTRLVQHELSNGVPAGRDNRISDGVAYRVDRLRATGNGQVPAVVRAAWELLNDF